MAAIERVYNVPLRKFWRRAPIYKRANRAVNALIDFLARTFRVDEANVRLGRHINMKIWERGIKFPPHHIKINVTKTDDGLVRAELEGFKYEEKKISAKKEEKKPGLAGKLQELRESSETPKKEEAKEEKKAEPKKEEPKHEAKKEELKKEHHAEKKPEHKKEEHHKEAKKEDKKHPAKKK